MGIDLDALERLEKAAHAAPWRWTDEYESCHGGKAWSLLTEGGYGVLSCDEANAPQGIGGAADQASADLMVALRNAAPSLLSSARRVEELEGLYKCDRCGGPRGVRIGGETVCGMCRMAERVEALEALLREVAELRHGVRPHPTGCSMSSMSADLSRRIDAALEGK